jgi:AcrR family transcriptional regulator
VMDSASEKPEGLRERKRRQTLERIAEAGLKLFIKNGYEATTLDSIATAAGISRRTFFYYFRSKEGVLLAWQGGGYKEALRPTMLEQSRNQTPLDAARKCLLKLVLRYETKESVIVDKLLRSTEALRLCKEAVYVQMEQTLAEAMYEMWPDAARRNEFRLVAMVAISALRLALDNWRQTNAERPLAFYLRQSFALLKVQL